MAAGKRYNVMVPRQYKTSSGEEKTTFWQIGTAFPLREKDGFSIELWNRFLPSGRLVMFIHEQREDTPEPPPEDDVPF